MEMARDSAKVGGCGARGVLGDCSSLRKSTEWGTEVILGCINIRAVTRGRRAQLLAAKPAGEFILG